MIIRGKSLLGVAVAAVTLMGLTACGSSTTTTPAASSSTASGSASAAASVSASATARSGSGGATADESLVGTTFVATEVSGSRTIVPNSMISVTFVDDKQLSATAGCNTMTGAYTITGETLSAPMMASTRMACADNAVSEQETWFAGFLAASPTFTLVDGTLTLTDGTDTVVFVGAPSGADAVPSTGWKLTDLITVSGSTVTAVDSSLTAWVRFADGEVAFNNSCNVGGGSAEIGADTIIFGALRSTLIFCDGPSGGVETAMSAVLQGVTPYEVTTDAAATRLKIMAEDGVTGLWFEADPTVGADAFPSGSGSASATVSSSG